jgi:hypothetical protein
VVLVLVLVLVLVARRVEQPAQELAPALSRRAAVPRPGLPPAVWRIPLPAA